MDIIKVAPLENELPSAYADRLGIKYSSLVNTEHKKNLGQYFTPQEIASFMASFCVVNKNQLNILDPGAGIGILACAVVEHIIENYQGIEGIHLTVFETDEKVLGYTDQCLNYLSTWAHNRKVRFRHHLCINDFILHNTAILDNQTTNELYDIIILNPPYFKIPNKDSRAIAAKNVINGQSNIYSIFLVIAAKLLNIGGQIIFITPRSFSSGNYFKRFREIFFSLVDIRYIHIFDSRRDAFSRDSVLQENIIVAGTRVSNNNNKLVQISKSRGIFDIEDCDIYNYRLEELVNLSSEQKILFIPSSNKDDDAIRVFNTWSGSFKQYDINISTGPVVDFRSLDFITATQEEGTVPLLYLHNISQMKICWDDNTLVKGKAKGQYILNNEKSAGRLLSNKNYVLLRRFSTKDDKSRLIAAPYESSFFAEHEKIGLENHLNYIYKQNGSFTKEELYGISMLLNSTLFDIYVRTFNGTTNISATELKTFTLPDMSLIIRIGAESIKTPKLTQETIDTIIEKNLIL